MLQETVVAVFTHTPNLYDKVADSVKTLGVAVTQFAYGERLDAVERWAGASNLIALFDATSDERDRLAIPMLAIAMVECRLTKLRLLTPP